MKEKNSLSFLEVVVLGLGSILLILLFCHDPYHHVYVETKQVLAHDQEERTYVATIERNELGESQIADIQEIK